MDGQGFFVKGLPTLGGEVGEAGLEIEAAEPCFCLFNLAQFGRRLSSCLAWFHPIGLKFLRCSGYHQAKNANRMDNLASGLGRSCRNHYK
jgi:hypothetical protein